MMRRRGPFLTALAALGLWATTAGASFTQTLPKGVILLEAFYAQSVVDSRYDDHGHRVPLVDEIDRYEPGAGKQGTLIPEARAQYDILVAQLQVGIFDEWAVGVGVPIVLRTTVDPNLKWEEGDWQWNIGREYSEDDFWEWAASMGQPRPTTWTGNEGVLADMVVATRWRFSDRLPAFRRADTAMALFLFYAIPTGRDPDPEEVVAAGTTSWDLHAAGDLGLHLACEKFFTRSLDGRLALGVEGFYEVFFPKRLRAPDGDKNPLLLTYSPYVGKHYTLDPGDFLGGSLETDVIPYRGPALRTWLVRKDSEAARSLPPILTLTLRYTFTYLFQSDWESESEIWDYERETLWRPGYKNILFGRLGVSLLRLGVPLMPYVAYRNQTWIPGKNSRPADALLLGVQIPLKLAAGM